MNRQTLITLTGPTCAGKSHLEQLLIDAGAARVISNTSRQPRSGEVDGVHYRFRDRDWFSTKMFRGDLVESVEFNGNFYGNTEECIRDALSRGDGLAVWVIEPHGHKQVKGWASSTPAGKMILHYSVFVDNPMEVIANRFLDRYLRDLADASDTQKVAATAAARLTVMMTNERKWVADALYDLNEGHTLYDLFCERYGPDNQEDIVRFLVALARRSRTYGHANDGMNFNIRSAA